MKGSSLTYARRLALLAVTIAVLALAACGGAAETGEESAAADASVTGTVIYLQRSTLPPGAVVTVQVQDVSRMDAPAEVIGEQVITTGGEQVPIAYEVPYSTADIVDNHRYVVRATIDNADGRLIFTSDTAIPVITDGAPTSGVEIMVVPVAGSAAPDASVTGTVTYMQRSALAPGSIITVQVQDVSRMDAPAEVVGEQVITTSGEQVPIAYEVPFNMAGIMDDHSYVVRATIDDPTGALIFTSDTAIPVITDGAPTSGVEIMVVPVGGAAAPDASVTGTVTYLPRIALPDDAYVSVRIEDVSLADAPSTVIGEQVFITAGAQVPLEYEVGYNSADIVENRSYVVSARITDAAGNLLFINDTAIPVITGGAPTEDVEIMVVPVGAATAPDASVTGTVTYLPRIALAPGSVIMVQVQDVSRMDAPAEVIGEQVIVTTDEQVPVAYDVPYSSADIIDNHSYVVRATIDSPDGKLIFTSDTAIPVITRDAPTADVEILVVPVGGATTDAAITGTVTYVQRIALAPGSVITVQLRDISLADAPAVVLGEQVIVTTDEQVPVAYEVGYNSADIVDNHTYAMQARITDAAGTLLFINDTTIPVITRDAPSDNVEILVVPVQ